MRLRSEGGMVELRLAHLRGWVDHRCEPFRLVLQGDDSHGGLDTGLDEGDLNLPSNMSASEHMKGACIDIRDEPTG